MAGPTLQIVIDCADPAALAPFWAELLGYQLQPPPGDFDSWEAFLESVGVPPEEHNDASAIIDPGGTRPRIYFQRVPEGKAVKNRVHLDVNAGGGHGVPVEERAEKVAAAVRRAIELGATKLYEMADPRLGDAHVTLADPEGNEFCIQ